MTAKSDAAEAKAEAAMEAKTAREEGLHAGAEDHPDAPADPPAPLLHVLAAAVHANASPTFKHAIEASLKFHHGHDKESLAAPKEEKHHAVSGHHSR